MNSLYLIELVILVCISAFSLSQQILVTSTNAPTLDICVFDESAYATPFELYNLARIKGSSQLAYDHISSYILPAGITAQLHFIDSGPDCFSARAPLVGAIDLINQGVNCEVYIGPGCSSDADSLYSFSDYYKTPMVAIPAASVEDYGYNRSEYPLLIRLSYNFADVCDTLVNFLLQYNYSHTTVFVDDTQVFYNEMGTDLTKTYKNHEQLNSGSQIKTLKTGNTVVSDDTLRTMLVEANRTSRVFVILGNATLLRRFMLTANELKLLNGEYVYFAINLFESKYWGSFSWETGGIKDQVVRSGYRSLKLITMIRQQSSDYDTYATQVRKISQDKFNYTFGIFESIDPITIGYYEGIIFYAQIVHELHRQGANFTNGTLVAESMKNVSFSSPVNGVIKVDAQGDRYTDYGVKVFDDETGLFQIAMTYNDRDKLKMVGPVTWPFRNSPPPDEPYCGFSDDAGRCRTTMVSLSGGIIALCVILPLLFFMTMVFTLAYLFIKRIESSFDPNWWRIPQDDLQIFGVTSCVTSKSENSLRNDVETMVTKSSKASTSVQSYFGSFFNNRAYYQGSMVAIRDVLKVKVHPGSDLINDLKLVKNIVHENIHKLIGITVNIQENLCVHVVAELCSHGSLQDVLTHETVKLDWSFKNSIIRDIVLGMDYIHASAMISHGDLNSYTCLVDSRFTVKISDAGLWLLRDPDTLRPPTIRDVEERDYEILLWRAPELLRTKMSPKGTQKGDVFSFGIILQQIILRCEPYQIPTDFASLDISKQEIVLEVQKGIDPPLRPKVPRTACSNEVYSLMEQCWSEYALERPAFARIKDNLKKVIGKIGDNLVDDLLKRMEEYAGELEQQVQEKTRQFMSEKQRSEELLGQLLPKSVAEALTKGQAVNPESYDSVTIYFSDIVDFTKMSAMGSPMDVVTLLNSLYTLFDTVIEKYDVYKVETIGDAYMVCSGLPVRNGNRHAKEIALMSIHIRNNMASFVNPYRKQENVQVRIGCHTGSCVAGIVGMKMPRFCLFGDTVNTASRMESTSEAMKIQLSQETHDCLVHIGGFLMESRGPVSIKGKGVLNTFWLLAAI